MHISMIAGLSYDQMMSQRTEMTEILRGILTEAEKKDNEFDGRCELIEFNGNNGFFIFCFLNYRNTIACVSDLQSRHIIITVLNREYTRLNYLIKT